jgi:type II secretory pathway component GspD/PulD (secretin)
MRPARTARRHSSFPRVLILALALIASAFTSAGAAEAGPVALSIAAQPLDAALRALSAATGAPVAFSQTLLDGRNAPAVAGNLTARQAAERLLEGSGLIVLQDGETLIIQPAPAPAPRAVAPGEMATLPEITVSAEAERDTLTEGSGSYTTWATNTTMKLPLTLRETPQTLTVITRQQIEDFGLVVNRVN